MSNQLRLLSRFLSKQRQPTTTTSTTLFFPTTSTTTRLFSGSAEYKIHERPQPKNRITLGSIRHLKISYHPGNLPSQQGAGSSKGVYEWIRNPSNIAQLQQQRPELQIEVTEDAEIHPSATATYSQGQQRTIWLRKMSCEETSQAIKSLTDRTGNTYNRKWPYAMNRVESFQRPNNK